MPAYNFQAQFAPDVESGRKRQTIRPKRKRPTKPGDTLYLYTGMRTKACRKLRKAVCQSVKEITVFPHDMMLGDRYLSYLEQIEMAGADGFDSLRAFRLFFAERYGLPFEGELIEW